MPHDRLEPPEEAFLPEKLKPERPRLAECDRCLPRDVPDSMLHPNDVCLDGRQSTDRDAAAGGVTQVDPSCVRNPPPEAIGQRPAVEETLWATRSSPST